MLLQEPMLLAITVYMSFVYGVVYLLFEALPFVFIQVSRLGHDGRLGHSLISQVHGFNEGENGLAFLALPLGGAICVGL